MSQCQAETTEDVPDVHAADRRPGFARKRGPSAGLPDDDGRGRDHIHFYHDCCALHGRCEYFPRATYVHGGKLRSPIATVQSILLSCSTRQLCVQPDRVCMALAQLSFSSVANSSLPLTSRRACPKHDYNKLQ